MTPSILFWVGGIPGTKGRRQGGLFPPLARELPLQPPLPSVEPRGRKGKVLNQADLIPLVWPGGGTKALASIYLKGSIHQQTVEA